MSPTPETWVDANVPTTGADTVEHCSCGCPVVVSPGAMERHIQRVHIPPAPARAGVNVQRWERQW